MVDFKALKKSSKNDFSKLNEKISQLNEGGFQKEDERFWTLTVDKAGNGEAIIRFLPPVDGEQLPFVRYWDHGFKGPGGWYIELSRTSLKDPVTGQSQADPVSEYNTVQWNTGGQAGKDFVSGTPGNPGSKRRLHYISNIYVVKDYANPKNDGKVFLFRYGKKIFDHLNELMNPKFESKTPINPFDFWTGANFILRACKEDGFRNYGQSEWTSAAPLAEDATMEKIWQSQQGLEQFLDPKLFKPYEELQRKLQRVMNTTVNAPATVEQEQPVQPRSRPEPKVEAKEETPPWSTDDEDDDLAAFKKLAQQTH